MLRAVLKGAGAGALILALALLLLEGLLRVGALFVHDRAVLGRPDARYRVLCVGDSHTYGALVPPDEAYPSQLERLLDAQAPGRYAVVNVGVPGMSTGQILERLPDLVRRYEPDLILVWAGVNNSWNRAGEGGEHSELAVRLDRLAAHTRLYRLARTWLHDRRLDRDRAVHDQRRAWEVLDPQNALRGEGAFTVRREDGVIETLEHDRDEQTPADAVWQQRTERDYAAIARYARAAGLPVAFIGYPLGEIGVAAVVNRALRNVAQAEDVPVVDAAASALRIPFEERHFLWAGHPDGRMYGEIARDVLPVVLRSLPPEG